MEVHNQAPSKRMAGWKACAKGVQAKGLQVWLRRRGTSSSDAQASVPPYPLFIFLF